MSVHWKSLDTLGRIEAIRSVWFSGCSTAQIAANLGGVTRNAIIGMYHRYPNSLTDKPLTKHGAVGDVAAQKRKGNRRKASLFPFQLVTKTSKPMAPPVETEFEHRLVGKPLWILKASECRFPVNDAARDEVHLFCSLPAEQNRPYCAGHRVRAHRSVS